MTDKAPHKRSFEDLRRRAEAFLDTTRPEHPESSRMGDARALVHELQVHQVELELQNEELMRARQEAEELRIRYHDLYDFAPVGYFILDEKERISEANLAGAALLDTDRKDLIGIPFTRFILPEDQDIFYLHKREVLQSQVSQTCELRFGGKDRQTSEPLYVLLKSVAMARSSGGSVKLRVNVTDITAHKRAEESLRDSEERFHRLFEEDLTGDFLCTLDGKILFCNPAFAVIFGFTSPDEAVDTNMLEFYPDPRERKVFLEALRQHGKLKGHEAWRKRRDGESIHVVENLVGLFNERGELYEIQGYIFDDTERKRAEETIRTLNAELEMRVRERTAELEKANADLQESQSRFREVLETSLDAAYRRNLQTDAYDYMGPRIFELTGYTAEEMISMPFSELLSLFHPDEQNRLENELRDETREKKLLRYRFKCKNGQYKWLSNAIALIKDPSGTPLFRVGSIRDITERKRDEEALATYASKLEALNQDLETSNEKLKRLNKEMQDFVFVASHDLQEPLRKIQTFSDLLQGQQALSEEQKQDYFGRMQHAAARMRIMIHGLLEFSRITTTGQPFSEVNLSEPARTALEMVDLMIRETGAAVEVGDLPSIDTDRAQMVQLFYNLVENASKFRQKDRSPVIRIYRESVEDGWARIMVEDNGIGFDEKDLERIFVPFRRLHGKDAYAGVGMGLSICKRIVERHGGKITAKSSPGKGATFIVDLPVKQIRSE